MNYSYPIISNSDALNAFNAFRENIPHNVGPSITREGAGPDIVANVDFNNLLRDLLGIWNASNGQRKAADFEAKASAVVHDYLKDISPYVATDARFWLWLTFAAAGGGFKDLVNNRFSGGSAANYGFDNLPECLFFRLWWRGYKMPEEDYNLAKRGDIDLWRSHLIRVEISYPEVMARSLIKKVNPLPGQTSTADQQHVRNLVKLKLSPRHASCAFETLSDEQCASLINELEQEMQNQGGQ
jgi:hypothetical protein